MPPSGLMSCRPTSPFRKPKKSTKEFHVYPRPRGQGAVSMSEHASFWYISSQSVHSPERSDIALAETCIMPSRPTASFILRDVQVECDYSGSFSAQLAALDIQVMLADFALPLSSWRVRAHRIDDQFIARSFPMLPLPESKKVKQTLATHHHLVLRKFTERY